jgi:hypothetical protein
MAGDQPDIVCVHVVCLTFSLKNARQITAALAEVFPDDPCLGDFALFGLGVNGEISRVNIRFESADLPG